MVTHGTHAPEFTLQGICRGAEQEYRLADFRGKWVILYFYPKDQTPGCTKEACDFRDNLMTLQSMGAVVIGVSRDTVATHRRFIEKQGLPFILLSDPEGQISAAYEILKEKIQYGKTTVGLERSTFLIDPQGVIAFAWRGVSVSGHVHEIISTLKNAQKS
jgi:thioredoxin-dependent peroxiredoxin